jgi:hypothetical protein
MSKIIFSFVLLCVSLYASNILSYNIYDRTDRVDIMLTFDTPYEGKIIKSKINSKIILKLYDAKIESTKIKTLPSKFLRKISINPMSNYTQIVATIPSSDIALKVSKTADAYGLRLRFIKKQATKNTTNVSNLNLKSKTSTLSNLPTKKSNDISTSYFIVVTLLIVGIIILLVLKKKVAQTPNNNQQNSKSWLFKTPQAPTIKQNTKKEPIQKSSQNSDEVTIRFQKHIDEKNSVVMLDFLNQSYLIIIGEYNNILLDKFTDNIPTTQSEFEELLKDKNLKLDEYLKVEQKPQEEEKEDILKSFSSKASKTPYDDF